MRTDVLMNGSMVKNHISFKTVFEYNVTQRTSFPNVVPGLSTNSSSSSHPSTYPTSSSSSSTSPTTTVSSDSETREREDLCGIDSYPVSVSSSRVERLERCDPLLTKPTKNPKPNKNENHDLEWGDTGMAARIQRKSRGWQSSWTQRLTRQFFWSIFRAHVYEKWGFGWTQCLYSLPSPKLRDLSEDQNYKGGACRIRTCGVVPRAEFCGDLTTADHILSEGCESRNNHRYAVVVQDLATQWIQAYPCKTKTSQETQRSLQKFLEPNRKPKVIYTDNSLEFGKTCEDFFLESLYGWWADSWECFSDLRNVQDLLSGVKTPCERRFGKPFNGPIIPFGSLVECYLISAKDITVICTDNSLEFGKACEDLSWNHCTSTPHSRNEWDCWESSTQNYRRDVCCIVAILSGWKVLGEFHGMQHQPAAHSRPLGGWENSVERRFGESFKVPNVPFGSLVEYHPFSTNDQWRIRQLGKKVLLGFFL